MEQRKKRTMSDSASEREKDRGTRAKRRYDVRGRHEHKERREKRGGRDGGGKKMKKRRKERGIYYERQKRE